MFQSVEGLRKQVEAHERALAKAQNHVVELEKALRRASDDNVALAKRVKYAEERLRVLLHPKPYEPPED